MTWTIYGEKWSGAFAVEAALAEAGAKYEFREVSLERNEQRQPDFLRLNPVGKMPAVQLPEGKILTETLAILLTISERFPDAQLLPPPGSFARAEALRWLAFMTSEIYPMVEIDDYPARFVPEGAQSEGLKIKARDRIRERLMILESAVSGPWLLADGFSLADIYAALFISWNSARDWRDQHVPKICGIARGVAKRPRIAPVWPPQFPIP
ncbi:MAG: glutathione S-transferase family protein [Rhizomicrobium sp.]